MMTLTHPWQALASIVEHNTRDLIAGRFTLASEVASWFKTMAMLRESEGERLMDNDPTPDDLNWHRALVATLIADGERLLLEWPANGPATADRISRADLSAAVRGLYSSQSMWHGELTSDQRKTIIQQVFGVDADKLQFSLVTAAA